MRGTLRIEKQVAGTLQARILGRLSEGEILGEGTYLLGTMAGAVVIWC